MSKKTPTTVPYDPWRKMRSYTDARIGLGRAGGSVPTAAQLQFNLDHAAARDAIYSILDVKSLSQQIAALGQVSLCLNSQAVNRQEYLQRPDLGRRLATASAEKLMSYQAKHINDKAAIDVAIVLADGLSASAIAHHGVNTLVYLLDELSALRLTLGPICIVQQGRVAVGDEVAERLNARYLIMLIGERPGLSAPDSLGIYYTYNAKIGSNDAQRNCISNIRSEGLSYQQAISKLIWLLKESSLKQFSGVNLKDKSEQLITNTIAGKTFLLK